MSMAIRWICTLLLGVCVTATAETLERARMAANETAAAACCKAYAEAQEIYRRTDYDQDGMLEYSQCIRGGQKKLPAPASDLEKLPKPSDEETKVIQALVTEMGADDFAKRQKAYESLQKFGSKALGLLQTASTEQKDAEISSRCKTLVAEISDSLNPAAKHDTWFGLINRGDQLLGLLDKAFGEAECFEGVDHAKREPKAGYLFRVLHKQGKNAMGGARDYIVNGNMTLGYALLAFPKEYGKTGAKCFVINSNGTIYEKDMGSKEKTEEFVKACKEFDPDNSWAASE